MKETNPSPMVMVEMAEMEASAAGFDDSKNIPAFRLTSTQNR